MCATHPGAGSGRLGEERSAQRPRADSTTTAEDLGQGEARRSARGRAARRATGPDMSGIGPRAHCLCPITLTALLRSASLTGSMTEGTPTSTAPATMAV